MSDEQVFKLEFGTEEVTGRNEDETIYLEPLLHNFADDYFRDLKFIMPAMVIGVQGLEELRIDVKPLNKIRHRDGTISELPNIENIPLMCYGTDDSAILMNVKQGQTVLVVFSQLSLDEFKGGSITPYSSRNNRKHDFQDAIAIPSIFPFNRSPNNKLRHATDHSTDDLTIVHNLGVSGKENKVVLKKSGAISIISSKDVLIDAPSSKFNGTVHSTGDISTDGDMIIKGRSVEKFMDTHTHNYTDNGSTLVTTVPIPT